jgi:two-component system phosphate regulon sensor histidine kinase PhoR
MTAVSVIACIFIVQYYWLRKAFDISEIQFSQSVQIALTHVGAQLEKSTPSTTYPVNSVEKLSSGYYILNINGKIDTSLLRASLQKEFAARNMKACLEYGIYDSLNHQMIFGERIGPPALPANRKPPMLKTGQYYVGIFLPGKNFHIAGEMRWWLFSTFLLLVIVVFFGYAVFIILKQKKLSELQKSFVNNMTHEFRTPIATVSLAAETLKNHPAAANYAELLTFSGIIAEEAERLDRHVEKILQMASTSATRMKLNKEALDLHALIRELLARYAVAFIKHRIIDLRLLAGNYIIHADRMHLYNMILNLVDNACKYSSSQSPVLITTQNIDGHLILSVEDQGIGIGEKFKKKIFKQFFRVPTGNVHNVKGFGLGLSYVKNTVSAHRWKIDFRSRENVGSRFNLYIPV